MVGSAAPVASGRGVGSAVWIAASPLALPLGEGRALGRWGCGVHQPEPAASPEAAGARARYVDVLNPGGPQRSEAAPAPAEFFAPLAPLPIPPHLFGPNAGRWYGAF